MKRPSVATSLLLAALLTVLASGCHWAMLGAGPTHTSHNVAERTLGPSNVASLQPAWTAAIGGGPLQWESPWSPAVGDEAVVVDPEPAHQRADTNHERAAGERGEPLARPRLVLEQPVGRGVAQRHRLGVLLDSRE